MAIAQGVAKQTRFKRQTAKGTIAVGSSGGQVLRRTSVVSEHQRETYTTADEITATQQLVSVRLGVKLESVAANGILSPGTYSDLLSSLLRRDFAAVTSITGASITVAGSGPTYTLTRAAGSFLTDGIKKGMVVRLTAGSFNAANLNKNMFVTAVTATVLTVVLFSGIAALVAEGPVASATVAVPGKVTFTPITGHTSIYYTFEEWMPDVPYSERFQDVRIGQATLNIPGSGNATIALQASGLDYSTATSVYFTAPTAETSTEACVSASGVLQVGGVTQAVVTDLQVTLNASLTPADGVVGSNTRPDIFVGKVMASGQFTAYFDSATIADSFTNETDSSILAALAAGGLAASDFITLALYKLNVTSMTPEDGERGLKRTYQFTAEYNAAGGSGTDSQQSTIQIQDSQAA